MKQGLSRLFGKQTQPPRQQSDKLWSAEKEFDERWKKRISTMAGLIATPGPVADLGCGMMWLEQFLGPSNSYVPVDYMRRDDRTLVVDFNKDALPELEARVAFLSGALEYVTDAVEFLKVISARKFEQVIMSYCTTEKFPNMNVRRGLNWTSNLSIYQILTALTPQYDLTAFVETEARDTIFAFKRKA